MFKWFNITFFLLFIYTDLFIPPVRSILAAKSFAAPAPCFNSYSKFRNALGAFP